MSQGRYLSDLAWRGYDPRAAFPHLAAAGAASVALLVGRWYLDDLSDLVDRVGALALYGLVLAVWPGLLVILLYRAITYTYRLTDRAVLVDRGFRNPPEAPIWLVDVTEVRSGATWFGQRVGVGWVRVVTTGGRAVQLTGVRDPPQFAASVRDAVAQAHAEERPAAPKE